MGVVYGEVDGVCDGVWGGYICGVDIDDGL